MFWGCGLKVPLHSYVFNSGYFWSRFSCDLSPPEQVLSRAPDPGPAADVSQADQVPGHLSVEQHRPPAQTGNEITFS
jgi:hypothetical protein